MYIGANERSPIKEHTREEEQETRGNVKQPSAYSRFFDEPENAEDEAEYNVATAIEETSDSSSRRWGFW
jgi:hypothetical protein